MDNDDLDEDIERLKIVLQDDDEEEAGSDGELRVLDNIEEEYHSNASRPSTSSDITASSMPTTSMCTDADEVPIRFDPQMVTAETCLAMNRAYQEVLLDTLRQIEMSLTENRARQRQLEDSMDEKTKKTDKVNKDNTEWKDCKLLPYFRDKDGQIPPANLDVALKERMEEDKQHVRPKTGWSRVQRKKLLNAIKLDALEQLIRPLLSKQEVAVEKLARCKNQEEIDAAKSRIEQITMEIKHKQETPADELLKNVDTDKIDFMKISALTFDNKFDASECESIWRNVLHQGINREPWTEEENAELDKLVQKHQMRNWKQIAAELGTNRTPFQCLQHHQNRSVIYDTSEWTKEEDELLKEVVETCMYGTGRVPWFQVAYYIDRRSSAQCKSRWFTIDPNRNTGRWTEEEDLQLLAAVQANGREVRNWMKIADHVPTRNAAQCRERFVNGFNETLVNRPWTYEEDKKLLTLVQQRGKKWVELSQEFVGRNDNACLLRHKRLLKWQQLMDQYRSQPKSVQKELMHPAFEFGERGEFIRKKGLLPRTFKPGRQTGCPSRKSKTEIQKLKEMSRGMLTQSITGEDDDEQPASKEVAIKAIRIKQEPGEAIKDAKQTAAEKESTEVEEQSDEESRRNLKNLQNSFDAFLATYNIAMLDYHKMWEDEMNGGLVVPRPPPVKKYLSRKQNLMWRKTNNLSDLVITQIDKYLKSMGERSEDLVDNNLYSQIANSIRGATDLQKKQMILELFNGKNPSYLSVRELLRISRSLKAISRRSKPKKADPWEDGEESVDEAASSSSEESVHEISDEEEKKPKRPMTEKQKLWQSKLGDTIRENHSLVNRIKAVIRSKMTVHEISRTRRKKFCIYPKNILMKYRSLDEERRMHRKSLVLLMKSLDIDAKQTFLKAKKSKRRLSAMAFLKSAEKSHLRKAKTRGQKKEINEVASTRATMNSELSESADYILDIQDELDINEEEMEQEEKVGDMEDEDEDSSNDNAAKQPSGASADQTSTEMQNYDKCLPFLPPNQTTLQGMRTLLFEHRCLIDQAKNYFSPQHLKTKLYQLKQKGPNPFMGVLNAIGKTESLEKRYVKLGLSREKVSSEVAEKRMQKVRNTLAYKQLKARFQALFSWPALLSTIYPPQDAPLPKSLTQPLEPPKPKKRKIKPEPIRTLFDDVIPQNGGVTRQGDDGNSQLVGVTSQNGDVTSQNGDVTSQNGDVTSQNGGVAVQDNSVVTQNSVDVIDEDLPEEEAVEKLVDKIMEQYELERQKKKRKLQPPKSRRIATEKRKIAFKEKERTKILKKLGLYEKMQEFKRQRQAASASTTDQRKQSPSAWPTGAPSATVGSAHAGQAADSVSCQTSTSDARHSSQDVSLADKTTICPSRPGVDESTAQVDSSKDTGGCTQEVAGGTQKVDCSRQEVGGSTSASGPLIASEGTNSAVANHSESCQADFNSDGELEQPEPAKTAVVPRKRGRPKGSKCKPYSGPLREKSERSSTSKTEDDYVSLKRKRVVSSELGSQYKMIRKLVPKLGSITSKISDIPILNEPLPEEPVKLPKLRKPPKPKRELKKVYKSKFKKYPNTLKDFEEVTKKSDHVLTTHKVSDIWRKIKAEAKESGENPLDKEVSSDIFGDDFESESKHNIVHDEEHIGGTEKIAEQGTTKKLHTVITSRMRKNLLNSQSGGSTLQSSESVSNGQRNDTNARTVKDVGGNNTSPSSNLSATSESQSESLGISTVTPASTHGTVPAGTPPVMIAVPVFIGGVQQIACVPFIPDAEGMITLPSGKKIDPKQARTTTDGLSLPVLSFEGSLT